MENKVYEDEISLKELIQTLLKRWKIIVIITVVALALAGFYACVIAKPSYESTIEGVISVHESANTKYGQYPYPTTYKKDYLSIIKSERVLNKTIDDLNLDTTYDKLSERITIESDENSNRFSFTITGEDPIETKKTLETLAINYIDEVELFYREKAVNYFISSFLLAFTEYEETEITLNKRIIDTQELLESVGPTITLKKLVTSDPVLVAQLLKQRGQSIEDLTDAMMVEEVINPHYNSLQGEVISLQKELDGLYITRDRDQRFLNELEQEQKNILADRQNPRKDRISEESLNVMDGQIHINSSATMPLSPVSPRKKMIISVAGILGLMLGVFIAFFAEYWEKA